jgi:NADPH:quinone reductase-like Zn-dependent oxidoreductase
MHAVVLREFGPPENLKWEEVPTPHPAAGEVLVRVGAVSIDLFQMVYRSGRGMPHVKLPRIMGNGIAGEIVELGCGAGRITLELAGPRRKVVALDTDPAVISVGAQLRDHGAAEVALAHRAAEVAREVDNPRPPGEVCARDGAGAGAGIGRWL